MQTVNRFCEKRYRALYVSFVCAMTHLLFEFENLSFHLSVIHSFSSLLRQIEPAGGSDGER